MDTYSCASNFSKSFAAKLTGWLPGNLATELVCGPRRANIKVRHTPFILEAAEGCDMVLEPAFLLRVVWDRNAGEVRYSWHGGAREEGAGEGELEQEKDRVFG